MAENSNIEWTDHTFNPWIGCTKVHAGCAHCYAEADMDTRRGRVQWGPHGTRSKTAEANWRKPLKWNANAQGLGLRAKVFCASLADVFEDWQGPIVDHQGVSMWRDAKPGEDDSLITGKMPVRMDDLRRALFALIDATPHLDWLLLTKRPENVRRMWPATPGVSSQHPAETYDEAMEIPYRPNVWLGTSVSDQASADKQIPELLKCRALAPVLFLSIEPLLEPISFRWAKWCPIPARETGITDEFDGLRLLDWVIVGGESGPGARPMHPQWVRDLRDQCTAAGVPFFFKQWGEWHPGEASEGECEVFFPHGIPSEVGATWDHKAHGMFFAKVGKKAAGRMLDGQIWKEFPDVTTSITS